MIVLDTNVISETMRRKPDGAVVAWLDSQLPNDLYLCAPVLAELNYGIALLEASERKTVLWNLCREMVTNVFDGRILAFDAAAAEAYGTLVASRKMSGSTISVMDALIAAIVKSNYATLATRNMSDFREIGLALVNPFGT
jgi:predicted nucleic acid-binding protein